MNQAKENIKRRNKARKNFKKYQNLMWKTPFSNPDRAIYKKRYEAAKQEIIDSYPGFVSALQIIL